MTYRDLSIDGSGILINLSHFNESIQRMNSESIDKKNTKMLCRMMMMMSEANLFLVFSSFENERTLLREDATHPPPVFFVWAEIDVRNKTKKLLHQVHNRSRSGHMCTYKICRWSLRVLPAASEFLAKLTQLVSISHMLLLLLLLLQFQILWSTAKLLLSKFVL